VALVASWVALPGAVPLFDGINFPDEPYRYVAPPAGYQKTPLPDHASGSTSVTGGISTSTVYVNTDEQAPQVNVVIFKGQLAVAAGVRSVTVSALPEAPDRQPSKGKIDGNVYHVSAVAVPSAAVSWAPPPGDTAALSQIVLRATSAAKPAPVFLYRAAPTLAWRVLSTAPIGNDVYRAQFAGLGEYALAFGVLAPPASSGLPVGLFVAVPVVVTVLVAAIVLLVVRFRRTS
jgi:hypothetical protein